VEPFAGTEPFNSFPFLPHQAVLESRAVLEQASTPMMIWIRW
jgi:hypothetical protein